MWEWIDIVLLASGFVVGFVFGPGAAYRAGLRRGRKDGEFDMVAIVRETCARLNSTQHDKAREPPENT